MYRKLKEQERKVKRGEEKEDMIDATEIDTEINTEGYAYQMLESFKFLCLVYFPSHTDFLVLSYKSNVVLGREQNRRAYYYFHGYVFGSLLGSYNC